MASRLQEVAAASAAETNAKIRQEAQVERDEDLIPLYYRGDMLFLVTKVADKLNPEKVHRLIKKSPDNMSTKRLKEWRPVEDKEFVQKLVAQLGGSSQLIDASGHFCYGQNELWCLPRKVAEALRRVNSKRAHSDARAPREAAKAQLSDIEGRSGGTVSPFISDNPLDLPSRSK